MSCDKSLKIAWQVSVVPILFNIIQTEMKKEGCGTEARLVWGNYFGTRELAGHLTNEKQVSIQTTKQKNMYYFVL